MHADCRWTTLVELLRFRANQSPEAAAFIFLNDGEDEQIPLTYRGLDAQARAISVRLRQSAPAGERALLLFQPGLEFISAFFGCLYAGVIAIPAYPPRNPRNVPRIQTIAADARSRFCLSSTAVLSRSRELFGIVPGLEKMDWIATDEVSSSEAAHWSAPEISRDSLAYLQYTSGSTSDPKGVMVSHGNLLHNLSFIFDPWGHPPGARIVSWLPFFHDMGLIYGVLQAVYGGCPSILLAPASFLQRPFRWLRAISKFRAESAIAPNFAYELCAQKVSAAEKAELDLSCWVRAHNAAEPVRAETCQQFITQFAGCGFRASFLKPAYGLAEATLAATYARKGDVIRILQLDRAELEKHRALEAPAGKSAASFVSCGRGAADQVMRIVDPRTHQACAAGQIGEIWISGPSMAKGYWEKPRETEETFCARLAGSNEGPFLRTGDLGFLDDGELFVTGRVKDMIIIRGANHYPQDIETAVQKCHPALQPDAGAAFAIELDGEEKLVLVQEVVRHAKGNLEEIIPLARQVVAELHGIQLHTLLLTKLNAVPKTSSGKIQRSLARTQFLSGELPVVLRWDAPAKLKETPEIGQAAAGPASMAGTAGDSLRNWILQQLAALLRIPAAQIDPLKPFSFYGLDSLGAMTLAGRLREKLGRELPAHLLFNFPSVQKLVAHLEENAAPNSTANRAAARDPIAVVGLACRFPGAENAQAFWRLLAEGVDAISDVPKDRWDAEAFYDPKPGVPGKMNTRFGGFLRNVRSFDARFFEISPREACQMDPQQRLLLEVAWEALESAAADPVSLAGSNTGVFIGISSFDYALLQLRKNAEVDAYAGTGLAHSIAANRLSYFLDLRGPSVAVDTACSSSLVAIHLACRSLQRGEANVALAGGVNLMASPEITIALSNARMLAADGRCKTFDARADGYVRGEGCGMVVLKRLADAERDGDPILAVVRGSAVNQDGHSNGLTAPNGPAQEEVIHAALDDAQVAPQEIAYVECHGTGTPLGDPQEIEALNRVLGPGRSGEQTCWISSVKTNIGHLEAAAGVAGFAKVILSLVHRQIPPHLHLTAVNPLIRLDQTPFKIPTALVDWPDHHLAGISSFGFGGANAHIILSAPPAAETKAAQSDLPRHHLFALSAKTEEALQSLAGRWATALAESEQPLVSLPDICRTALAGRAAFSCRLAAAVKSKAELAGLLRSFATGKSAESLYHGSSEDSGAPKIAFLFTGQGSQYLGMGRGLYASEPVFRDALDRCCEIAGQAGVRLRDLLLNGGSAELFDQPVYAQAALFSVEYALATLWQWWGVQPQALLGHSLGEYAAACISGVLDLSSALRLVLERARLIEKLPQRGTMAAVFDSPENVAQSLARFRRGISIAAINGPALTVVAGEAHSIQEFLSELKQNGIRSQRLATTHAFHSPLIEPVLAEFEAIANTLPARAPAIPILSNLTGHWIQNAPDEKYWAHHLREPVLFAQGIQTLLREGFTHFVECGPDSTLLSMGRRCLTEKNDSARACFWLPSLKEGQDDQDVIFQSAAQLYVAGARLELKRLAHTGARKVFLPTYPFQGEPFWCVEPEQGLESAEPSLPDLWLDINRAVGQHAGAAMPEEQLNAECEKLNALNELGLEYLARALKKLNAVPKAGRKISELLSSSTVQGRYHKAVNGWLERISSLPPGNPIDAWDRASKLWKDELYVAQLVRFCGQSLPEILTGKIDPLTIIFPNSSSEVMEKIYGETTIARFCNGVLRRMLEVILPSVPSGQPLRILEIGAGTGATTRCLLPALPPDRTVYTFTDLGPGFLQSARDKFSRFPFVEYRQFNVENDPVSQGFLAQQFQVVIASNVLHATRDLAQTLKNVAQLLAPGGFLLLWEATQPQTWMDISFSTLEGWQRFEDAQLRHSQPLLSPPQWLELLKKNFARAEAFPKPDSAAAQLGQTLFLASAPPPSVAPAVPPPPAPVTARAPVPSRLFYQIWWEKAGDAEPLDPIASRKIWGIISDSVESGMGLADAFQARGATPVMLIPAKSFRPISSRKWELDLIDSQQLARLFAEVSRTNLEWGGIVSALGTNLPPKLDRELAESAEKIMTEQLVPLLQYVVAHLTKPGKSPRLWLLTRGAQNVPTGAIHPVSPAAALLWGLGRSLASEHPDYFGGIIDLDPAKPPDENGRVAAWLSSKSDDNQCAFRGQSRYVCRLAPSNAATSTARKMKCSASGAYLITGGLGGIGRKIARWLVENGARHLILLHRAPLPPRTQWRALITAKDPAADRIQAILELESLGASVHLAAIDLGDASQVESFVTAWSGELRPPIRAVLHAAGLIENISLLESSAADFARIMRPKLQGTLNLTACLPLEQLDFVLLFSSAASLLGSPKTAAYAAANAFLDAVAHYLTQKGIPAISINWGSWENTGMANRNQRAELLTLQGIHPMPVSQALDALGIALDEKLTQLAILSVDWHQYFERNLRPSSLLAHLQERSEKRAAQSEQTSAATTAAPIGQALTGPVEENRVFLRQYVAELLKSKPDAIDVAQPLHRLGVDSIMAVQIKNEIEMRFHFSVTLQEISKSSINDLVARAGEPLAAA